MNLINILVKNEILIFEGSGNFNMFVFINGILNVLLMLSFIIGNVLVFGIILVIFLFCLLIIVLFCSLVLLDLFVGFVV